MVQYFSIPYVFLLYAEHTADVGHTNPLEYQTHPFWYVVILKFKKKITAGVGGTRL